MNKIIIDTAGGDRPDLLIKGAVQAANSHPDYKIVLVGDAEIVKSHIGLGAPNLEIVHAPDVITNDDVPTQAIRRKPDSSLIKSLNILKDDPEAVGLFSAGSTGAVLTGATLLIGRIHGVHRPVLASLMPTSVEGKLVCIADSGANIDSKPEFMAQFALMASVYMKAAFDIPSPTVGLLSVGTEEKKGDERTRAAYALIKDLPINFLGNMEARDTLTGKYDIIVCDGFSGNVLIKSTEGTAKMVMGKVKQAVKSSLRSKIGALFLKKSLYALKSSMDYHVYGGAPFLGIKKLVVKGHGSTNEVSVIASIERIISLHEHNVLDDIKSSISGYADSLESQSADTEAATSD